MVKEVLAGELQMQKVNKWYPGNVHAVIDMNMEIKQGEFIVFVGPSGCGKTTLLRMIAGLESITDGEMIMGGRVMNKIPPKNRDIAMVFQNYALYPNMKVKDNIAFPLKMRHTGKQETKSMVAEVAQKLELDTLLERKPGALSGGQRQRIAVARALLLNPELLICDESFSSQDILTQSQLLELLEEIQRKTQLSYLFISHDLQVVRRISQRMGVMYLGSMVEQGLTAEIYEEPWHPYTKELLRAMLPLDPKKAARQKRLILKETRNHSQDTENGCPYAPRCRYAMECCHKEKPGNYRFGEREVRCFLYSEAHTKKRAKDYHMTSQI